MGSEGIALNFFDPDFRQDPYPQYARLRQHSPVLEHPWGFVTVSSHAGCQTVLRKQTSSSDRRRSPHWQAWLGAQSSSVRGLIERGGRYRSFIFLDSPDHERLRGLVSQAFTPKVVAGMRSRVAEMADQLVANAGAGGTLDVIADLARPLPVAIITELMGVPTEDRPRVGLWSDALARGLEPEISISESELAARLSSAEEFAGYIAELAAHRRRHPGEDLVSALVAAEQAGDRLSPNELAATCMLLLAAGHETTRNLVGNAVAALAANPTQAEILARGKVPLRQALEELIRYDSPVQMLWRLLPDQTELADTTLPAESEVLLLIGSANHDESVFADPETLDLSRPPAQHLAFGFGIHHCLGAVLARLEAEAALAALLRRLPAFELAEEPQRRSTLVLRGYDSLMLACPAV